MRMTRRTTALLAAAGVLVLHAAPGEAVVNADYGNQVVSADPDLGTPHVMNGSVKAITRLGDKVIAAGTFTSVSPSGSFSDTSDDVVRNRIFAFDANTGVIDPTFNPNLGGPANSLDTDGTHVYVGGSFGSVSGTTGIKRVAKLNDAGTVVETFKAVPNKVVNEVVVRGSTLFIGGAFTSVKSRTVTSQRGALAALDTGTGAVLASLDLSFAGVYDPNKSNPGTTNVKRFDVTGDGSRLVAVGNFASVAGQTRAQVAMLDTGANPATVAPWATNRFDRAHNSCAGVFDAFVRDVDFAPDGSYFAVTSTGAFAGGAGSGTLCDTATRWETAGTGNDPTWVNYTGGDTLYGVAVTGSVVYVGGHQRWMNNPSQGDQAGPGAVPREGIAALDPVNGLPLSWNPGRDRGVGAQALFADGTGLWVGSDTTMVNNQRRGRIAFLPLSGGTQIPAVAPATLPNTLFGAQGSLFGVLVRRPVDANGAPTGPATTASSAIDWNSLRGGFLLNGTLYHGLSDGRLHKRTFNPATGAVGPDSIVNLYDDPDNEQRISWPIANLTGMFYDPATHRIYYTLSLDSRLYYRYFTPESEIVGATTFEADAGGTSFFSASGLTLAGGRILYGSLDGSLRSAPFSEGRVTGPATVVSADGSWNLRALFVPNG
jgi:hypothetical protein